MAKASKHLQGTIPRTYNAAIKAGLVPTDTKYRDLSDELKSTFLQFSDLGARRGTVCGVMNSTTPGNILICYKDPSGNCTWVEGPKAPAPFDHE